MFYCDKKKMQAKCLHNTVRVNVMGAEDAALRDLDANSAGKKVAMLRVRAACRRVQNPIT